MSLGVLELNRESSSHTISLEVVLLAEFAALHHLNDPLAAHMSKAVPGAALMDIVILARQKTQRRGPRTSMLKKLQFCRAPSTWRRWC
jgi:hypothetical protein